MREVIVAGDGPAGSAIAQALQRRKVDVELVGPDDEWTNTYGTWADDVEAVEMLDGFDVWAHRLDSIAAHFTQGRTIARPYGIIDNSALRCALRAGVDHRLATVASPDELDARIVIDATGWPSKIERASDRTDDERSEVAWQTAFGVVLREPPSGPLGSPMLMDFSEPELGVDPVAVPTFAYALPVDDGWLVEETVLAALPAVEPQRLLARLAARLAMTPTDLVEAAIRTEEVWIPMGAGIPDDDGLADSVVRYGAAAGMIHPATGYSIASSLACATRVAEAIGSALERGVADTSVAAAARRAVWPRSARRTRLLHEYGLGVLAGSDPDTVRNFFDTFFDLPTERWAAYLRIDTPPLELAAVMTSMFRRADWPLRARLVGSNPLPFVRLIRP